MSCGIFVSEWCVVYLSANVLWYIFLRMSCGIFVPKCREAYLSPSVLWYTCLQMTCSIFVSRSHVVYLFQMTFDIFVSDVMWYIWLPMSCGMFVSQWPVVYLSLNVLWYICFQIPLRASPPCRRPPTYGLRLADYAVRFKSLRLSRPNNVVADMFRFRKHHFVSLETTT